MCLGLAGGVESHTGVVAQGPWFGPAAFRERLKSRKAGERALRYMFFQGPRASGPAKWGMLLFLVMPQTKPLPLLPWPRRQGHGMTEKPQG